MPRTVYFYNNVGPIGLTTTSSSEPRNFAVNKTRDGVSDTGESRSIHINAVLMGEIVLGIIVNEIFVVRKKILRRRKVWGGGYIINRRVLWDGKGVQTSGERIERLVRQHINY